MERPHQLSLGRAPINGDSVVIADQTATSDDDLASLSLVNLTLNHSTVLVTGQSLDVATVIGGALIGPATYFGFLGAEATPGAPVTVTVGSITGTRSTYFASGGGSHVR